MPVKVVMPKWGTGMNEGKIVKWHKAAGDKLVEGEPLVEIETVKVVQDLEAPVSGVLVEILLPEGETAEVRAPIALIEED